MSSDGESITIDFKSFYFYFLTLVLGYKIALHNLSTYHSSKSYMRANDPQIPDWKRTNWSFLTRQTDDPEERIPTHAADVMTPESRSFTTTSEIPALNSPL